MPCSESLKRAGNEDMSLPMLVSAAPISAAPPLSPRSSIPSSCSPRSTALRARRLESHSPCVVEERVGDRNGEKREQEGKRLPTDDDAGNVAVVPRAYPSERASGQHARHEGHRRS